MHELHTIYGEILQYMSCRRGDTSTRNIKELKWNVADDKKSEVMRKRYAMCACADVRPGI